jgi:SsrA-binding protein
MPEAEIKTVSRNKKAYHDYFIEETYEAGLELYGTEVKSIREGKVNLKDAWCQVKDGEIFALGMHISPYEKGNIFNRDPMRPKRLLMHKREINKLFGLTKQQGYAIIPLSVYFVKGRAKLEVGLCKGKKLYDKREAAAEKDARRNIDRTLKSAGRKTRSADD